MESNYNDKPTKPNLFLKTIKFFLEIIFPFVKLKRINKLLSMAYKIENNPWFNEQRSKNLLISFFVPLPMLLSFTMGFIILFNNKIVLKSYKLLQQAIFNFEFSKAFKILSLLYNLDIWRYLLFFILAGLLVSVIMGLYVKFSLIVLKDTKKLNDLLIKNAVFDKNETDKIVLATPIGYLIDITGHKAEDLKYNQKIWVAMNIEIKDIKEDPDQRSIVLFLKRYKLKNVYEYKLDDFKAYLSKK